MASEQWLMNDTSVANNAYFTAVTGGSYKLQNTFGSTRNRVTSSPTPYEGAGCYASGTGNEGGIRFRDSASADLSGATYYFDAYMYSKFDTADGNRAPIVFGNDSAAEYSWAELNVDTSVSYGSYDPVNGPLRSGTTATGKYPDDAWFRLQVKSNQYGANEIRFFVSNINGTTPDTTVASFNFNTSYGFSTFEYISGLNGNGVTYPFYLDNIKFDNAAYPTRSTAHTADAAGTGTATGTAAMSRSRTLQASATGTATGTAAASNQRALAASATGTASGTGAMSLTQAMSASGTGTATGTAAGSITAVVTIDGAGTGTASATAGASSTQVFAGSATVTATGTADASIRPLVTVDGVGTITATGATTASKQQTLAATATANASATAGLISITPISASATVTATATALALITTPGTLYGNAEKVAGLYGSSTKPTLTTRS
jgi:hypothetical protein